MRVLTAVRAGPVPIRHRIAAAVVVRGQAHKAVVWSMEAGVHGLRVLQPAVRVLKPEAVPIPHHYAEERLAQVLPARAVIFIIAPPGGRQLIPMFRQTEI